MGLLELTWFGESLKIAESLYVQSVFFSVCPTPWQRPIQDEKHQSSLIILVSNVKLQLSSPQRLIFTQISSVTERVRILDPVSSDEADGRIGFLF